MQDNKDKIIAMQLELIRDMTERNLRGVSSDMWGSTTKSANAENIPVTPEKLNTQSGDAVNNTAKGKNGGDAPAAGSEEQEPLPKEDIGALKEELHGYIGLESVKAEVDSLINMATVYKLRREAGLPTADMSLHMVFTGNPGTGKTMIARFMARVYHSLGYLSKGHLVETDRSGLVAGYVGQTAMKTGKLADSAIGGVLFIDEAYSLTEGGENDFGGEAIDALLKKMEDNRDDLIVIVAGYPELMEDFIGSNPGLESRFNRYIEFEDYTAEEMFDIFKMQCKKNYYTLTESAESEVKRLLGVASEAAGVFGNARGVRNVFENVLVAQSNRLASVENLVEMTKEMLMEILPEDITAVEDKLRVE